MNVNPLQRQIVASDIAPEQLAGNSRLTEKQKIAEASRQFESVLLQQILGESQKTVIKSEFSDNSTAAGIYQDLITKTLSDNISKSGAFGLAKVFGAIPLGDVIALDAAGLSLFAIAGAEKSLGVGLGP